VPTNSFALGIFATTSPLTLNPLGGQLALGEGVIVTFLRGFFLTTAFFVAFAVAFGETVGLAVAFAVALAVGLGVALEVAAFVGNAVNASNSAITMPNGRLIAIPLKFADREEDSNYQPEKKNEKSATGFPRFCYFLGSK
jgi:hypothetical protein